jgi:hypothetical protein
VDEDHRRADGHRSLNTQGEVTRQSISSGC